MAFVTASSEGELRTMTIDRWITDTRASNRFVYYTRANADEVGPEPFSPLGWSLGWGRGCIPGTAAGFVDFGAVRWDEFDVDPPEVFGNWGGYFYNQLSLPRVMGARMPGASPAAIDQAYFGDHPGIPVYEPHPGDDDEAQSALLAQRMGWAMSTDGYPLQEHEAQRAREAVRSRPHLGALDDAELVARARAMAQQLQDAWRPYCVVCLAASLGPGAVQAVCAALGRPHDAVAVMTAVGDVESAGASFALWDLSRHVSASHELTMAFDLGVDDVLDRLAASGSAHARRFLDGWANFIADHGHRGPNEWDLRPHSWTTDPTMPLRMLERMRFQTEERSPHTAQVRNAAERERLTTELVAAAAEIDAELAGTLEAGIRSAGVFFALRERGKNTCIRLIHEAKLALYELGDRTVQRGHLPNREVLFNLVDAELETFLADPASFTATLVAREATYQLLHDLEPPYIVGADRGFPPISQWARRGAIDAEVATAGSVLQGGPGAPGVVTGRARIVRDPSDPFAIEPGDILVAATTDPAWTPLFLSAAGVVVNVGAVASHAVIVSRELGVPCAVSVVQATERIPDGATITVDGSTGTVTILDVGSG